MNELPTLGEHVDDERPGYPLEAAPGELPEGGDPGQQCSGSGIDAALSELERQGLIQSFEFTHELAWNVMKDYFIYQGNTAITGSRDAIREAFSTGLIEDGKGWMEMIQSRNRAV